jgi:hypothetical protein
MDGESVQPYAERFGRIVGFIVMLGVPLRAGESADV